MLAPRTTIHDPSARGPSPGAQRSRRLSRWLTGLLVAVGAFVLPAAPAFGEGSVDLNTGPGAMPRHGLTSAAAGGPNGGLGTPLQVYAGAGETIQLANSLMGLGAANIRVFAPGDDPTTATPVLDCAASQPGSGRIASRAQEIAGPLPNAGGYDACDFTVPADGIYTVIQDAATPSNGAMLTVDNPNTTITQGYNASMWDVTVRDAAGAAQDGRVFTTRIHLRTEFIDASGVEVFAYTKTGYEYQINFFNHAGGNWILVANDRGVIDSMTGERTFASFACGLDDGSANCAYTDAQVAPGQYPIFFNSVDPLVISGPGGLEATLGYSDTPISPASNPLTNAAFTGSDGQSGATNQGSGGTIGFTSPEAMESLGYTVEIDTDRNGTFGGGTDFVDDTGALSATGDNTLAWNGRDADGKVPACGDYPYRIRSTLAEVHFPMVDVENSVGGTQIERLSLTTDPALGNPLAASYNNHDPYKAGYVVTNGTPPAQTDGISGPGFNAWGPTAAQPSGTGNTDYIDTWTRLPEVQTTGTLSVVCAPPPPPWACDGSGFVSMYQGTVGNQTLLTRVVREADGTYGFENRATSDAGRLINALAFRAQDGYLYAWQNQPSTGLVRIADDGAGGAIIGAAQTVPGMPVFGAFAGTFLADGRYFIWGTPANPVGYVIDLSGPTPTLDATVTASWDASGAGRPLGDFAVSPVDGSLYAIVAGEIRQLTLSGSTLSLGPVVAPAGGQSGGSAGAQWFSPAGAQGTFVYSGNHADGTVHVYTTDLATGVISDLGSVGETVPNGDGAACANTLAVKKDAEPRTVTVGGELTYSYTISARGLVDNPVDFVDTLPAGMTYVPGGVTVNGTFGPTNNYAGTDTLSISGVIPRNTTVTITARVLVAQTAACNVDVPNQAQATMHAAGLPDVTIISDDPTTPIDPIDPTIVHINCPPPPPVPLRQTSNVTIDKTASAPRATVGDTVTYTLTARNQGPGEATDARVSDPVPSALDVRSATTTQGTCSVTGNQVSCALGRLTIGQTVTITVRAVALREGKTTNTATITDPVCTTTPCDSDPADVVIRKPTLGLTKGVSKTTLRAGETATYTIRVRNPSKRALRNVRVCDDLPSGLVFVKATPRARLSGGRYCWTVPSLGAGKSKTFKMTVRALEGTSGRKVNTATATSPDAATKRAKRTVRVIGGATSPDVITG